MSVRCSYIHDYPYVVTIGTCTYSYVFAYIITCKVCQNEDEDVKQQIFFTTNNKLYSVLLINALNFFRG